MSALARLEARCAELEAELAYYRASPERATLFCQLGLTRKPARLLEALVREPQSDVDLLVAMDSADASSELVKAQICNVRKVLKRAGAPAPVIKSIYGIGYELTEAARAWLKQRVPEAFVHNRGLSR